MGAAPQYSARGPLQRTFREHIERAIQAALAPSLNAATERAGEMGEWLATPEGEAFTEWARTGYAQTIQPQVETFLQTPLRDSLVEGAQAFVGGADPWESAQIAWQYAQDNFGRYASTLGTEAPVEERSFGEIEGFDPNAAVAADILASMIDIGGAVGRVAHGVAGGMRALKSGGKLGFLDDMGEALRRARTDFSDEALEGLARQTEGLTIAPPRFGNAPHPIAVSQHAVNEDVPALLLRHGSSPDDYVAVRGEVDLLHRRIEAMTPDEFAAEYALLYPGNAQTMQSDPAAFARVQEAMLDDLALSSRRLERAEEAARHRLAGRAHSLEELDIAPLDDLIIGEARPPGLDVDSITRQNYEKVVTVGAVGDHVDDLARTEVLNLIMENASEAMQALTGGDPTVMRRWLEAVSALGDETAIMARQALRQLDRLSEAGMPTVPQELQHQINMVVQNVAGERQVRNYVKAAEEFLSGSREFGKREIALIVSGVNPAQTQQALQASGNIPGRYFDTALAEAAEVQQHVIRSVHDAEMLRGLVPPAQTASIAATATRALPGPEDVSAAIARLKGPKELWGDVDELVETLVKRLDNFPNDIVPDVGISELEEMRSALSAAFAEYVVAGNLQEAQGAQRAIRNLNMMVDELANRLPPGQGTARRLMNDADQIIRNLDAGFDIDKLDPDALEAVNELGQFLQGPDAQALPEYVLDELWRMYHRLTWRPE
jgi:hypothetical protein